MNQAQSMDEESAPFIEKSLPRHLSGSSTSRHTAFIPWTIVAVLCIYITISNAITKQTTEIWHASDFVSARGAISTATTIFTSSLDFIDEAHIYRVFDPSTPEYVGNASKLIDQNWDDLILPADIYITDAEASTMPDDVHLYRNPVNGRYKVEVEMFHSLHCLNMIRMRLYSSDYPEMTTDNARIHVDHCVESLRELIMCEGNMTPIPIEWSSTGRRINPNYAQKHTCRNFEALRKWTTDRANNPF